MAEVISRAEAKSRGIKRYFTGTACPQGHMVERFTSDRSCVACRAERHRVWRAANREKHHAACAAWRANYPERARASNATWLAANPERHRANVVAWRAANPEKERARKAAWSAAHPEKILAYAANRRATKLMQRCVCCTDAQIEEFFLQTALYCGHVDHKTPLVLGGHHRVKNLQAMTDVDHREKTQLDHRTIAEARRRSCLLQAWRK
jgi:hypothetical protein